MTEPLIIYEHENCLFLSQGIQDSLRETPRSILWLHNGLYGMLPSALIQNELRIRADRKKLWEAEGDHEKPTVTSQRLWKDYWETPLGFRWAETQDVPNGAEIVKRLRMLSLKQQSDDSGTGDSDQGHD